MSKGGFSLRNLFRRKDKFYDAREPIEDDDNDIFFEPTDKDDENIKMCALCLDPLGGPGSIDVNGNIRTLTKLGCTGKHIVHTDEIVSYKLKKCPYDYEELDPTKFKLLDNSAVVYSTEFDRPDIGGNRRTRKNRRTRTRVNRRTRRTIKNRKTRINRRTRVNRRTRTRVNRRTRTRVNRRTRTRVNRRTKE